MYQIIYLIVLYFFSILVLLFANITCVESLVLNHRNWYDCFILLYLNVVALYLSNFHLIDFHMHRIIYSCCI